MVPVATVHDCYVATLYRESHDNALEYMVTVVIRAHMPLLRSCRCIANEKPFIEQALLWWSLRDEEFTFISLSYHNIIKQLLTLQRLRIDL